MNSLLHNNDELVDIVNTQDEIIGAIKRSEINPKIHILRYVVVNVINEQNQILVGKKHKNISENIWSIVGSGHLQSGEDPYQGAKRELYEESGIECDNLIFYSKEFNPKENKQGFVYLYKFHVDSRAIEFPAKNDEFLEYRWIGADYSIELSETAQRAMGMLGDNRLASYASA